MSKVKKGTFKNKKASRTPFWKSRKILIALIPVLVFIAIYFLYIKKSSNEPEWVKEGEVTFISKDTRQKLAKIDVEVAINPTERTQGLMYRTKMEEDNGMLFIFERDDMQSFWMKNTIISLDILFIDSKGVINTIHKSTVPFSEKSLPSKGKSQFVVEVNGGYCDRHGIKEGDLIEYKLDQK
jgi:hypothetical protein